MAQSSSPQRRPLGRALPFKRAKQQRGEPGRRPLVPHPGGPATSNTQTLRIHCPHLPFPGEGAAPPRSAHCGRRGAPRLFGNLLWGSHSPQGRGKTAAVGTSTPPTCLLGHECGPERDSDLRPGARVHAGIRSDRDRPHRPRSGSTVTHTCAHAHLQPRIPVLAHPHTPAPTRTHTHTCARAPHTRRPGWGRLDEAQRLSSIGVSVELVGPALPECGRRGHGPHPRGAAAAAAAGQGRLE